MNEYKIMIVDDEPDILELLEKSLAIEGFQNIIKIDNGLSAVSSCRELQPDMIILDVMLPGIDGYEVCKQVREFSLCPILFLSSKNDELDKILGLAVGGDDYVTKPFIVIRYSGEAGLLSIFSRKCRICTMIVLSHPKLSSPHTVSYSRSRLITRPIFCAMYCRISNSRAVSSISFPSFVTRQPSGSMLNALRW